MEAQHPLHPRRNVRLDTLVRLRWLAAIGQTVAVLVVHYVFDFNLPLTACLLVIACSAALNLVLRLRFRPIQRLEPDRAAWLLAFDIIQLALLLFLTGGVENPFVFLFLGPVLISATALPPRMTLMLGALAALCATALVFFHLPLPWVSDEPLELPPIYLLGVWFSLLVALGVIGAYSWQIAEEARLLTDALAATELVLAREQHLSQLDGLAAAAAHELGTPLSTIAVVVRERERVEVAARWSDGEVVIAIADDGPGFAPEILDRIGEPYLTSRGRPPGGEGEISGLGLGVFIAKTLLERTGAALTFANRAAPR